MGNIQNIAECILLNYEESRKNFDEMHRFDFCVMNEILVGILKYNKQKVPFSSLY